jgi:hypothetical protein
VSLDRLVYACDDTLIIEVRDADLAGAGTQTVIAVSMTEPSGEVVTLIENPPGSGRFTGALAVVPAPPVSGDGVLSVDDADTISVTYVDADDGSGGLNVTRTVQAAVNCSLTGRRASFVPREKSGP